MDRAQVIRIARLLPKDPAGFFEETTTRLQVAIERRLHPPRYAPTDLADLVAGLRSEAGIDITPHLQELELAAMEEEVSAALGGLRDRAQIPISHNADGTLARICYGLCRAMQPQQVIETGVANGVTSTFVLAALRRNGSGRLHSVDRPPRDSEAARWVGSLVPDRLRNRWRLHRGTSREKLPPLLGRRDRVDVFIHDSRHTYRNTLWELEQVTPHLASRAIVIADDIERNSAFEVWARRRRPQAWWAVREQKAGSLCGIAVMRASAEERP